MQVTAFPEGFLHWTLPWVGKGRTKRSGRKLETFSFNTKNFWKELFVTGKKRLGLEVPRMR